MSANGLLWASERHLWCKNTGEMAALFAVAGFVDKDLRGCFAKQATLAEKARCNTKTLRTHLHSLADKKVILPGDSGLVAHIRPDARPDVWDLNKDLPTDPTGGNSYPPRPVEVTPREGANLPERPVKNARATGKNARQEPGSEPGTETSSSPQPSADVHVPGARRPGGGGDPRQHQGSAAGLVTGLDYLGKGLQGWQAKRLTGHVEAALAAGWTEPQLRRHLDLGSGNGIDDAFAVYEARLKNAPTPPAAKTVTTVGCDICRQPGNPTPGWFGEDHEGRPRRCACNPRQK